MKFLGSQEPPEWLCPKAFQWSVLRSITSQTSRQSKPMMLGVWQRPLIGYSEILKNGKSKSKNKQSILVRALGKRQHFAILTCLRGAVVVDMARVCVWNPNS